MRIKPIASNMTELLLNDGSRVLFSYETTVAHYKPSEYLRRTSKKWSVTTSKHIGKWDIAKWSDLPYSEMPQEYFDNLVKGV
jgi:hypothetical protein